MPVRLRPGSRARRRGQRHTPTASRTCVRESGRMWPAVVRPQGKCDPHHRHPAPPPGTSRRGRRVAARPVLRGTRHWPGGHRAALTGNAASRVRPARFSSDPPGRQHQEPRNSQGTRPATARHLPAALQDAVANMKDRNIALAGRYGTGKSSVLDKFERPAGSDHRRWTRPSNRSTTSASDCSPEPSSHRKMPVRTAARNVAVMRWASSSSPPRPRSTSTAARSRSRAI
jgi:hypothetical protein